MLFWVRRKYWRWLPFCDKQQTPTKHNFSRRRGFKFVLFAKKFCGLEWSDLTSLSTVYFISREGGWDNVLTAWRFDPPHPSHLQAWRESPERKRMKVRWLPNFCEKSVETVLSFTQQLKASVCDLCMSGFLFHVKLRRRDFNVCSFFMWQCFGIYVAFCLFPFLRRFTRAVQGRVWQEVHWFQIIDRCCWSSFVETNRFADFLVLLSIVVCWRHFQMLAIRKFFMWLYSQQSFYPAQFNTVFYWCTLRRRLNIFSWASGFTGISFGYPPNPPWCGVGLTPTLQKQLALSGGLQLQVCSLELWSCDFFTLLWKTCVAWCHEDIFGGRIECVGQTTLAKKKLAVGFHLIQSSALVMSFSFVSAVDICDVWFYSSVYVYRVDTVGSVCAYTCLRRLLFMQHATASPPLSTPSIA